MSDALVLEATKCPLCDHYAVGGVKPAWCGGFNALGGWAFRMDLGGKAVCPHCHETLGIDTVREKWRQQLAK